MEETIRRHKQHRNDGGILLPLLALVVAVGSILYVHVIPEALRDQQSFDGGVWQEVINYCDTGTFSHPYTQQVKDKAIAALQLYVENHPWRMRLADPAVQTETMLLLQGEDDVACDLLEAYLRIKRK